MKTGLQDRLRRPQRDRVASDTGPMTSSISNQQPSTIRGEAHAVGEAAGGEPFTCVIAEGTAIYVRVAGTECSTLEPPPFFGRNEDELRACATADLDGVTNYQARINGQDVADLDAYRIGSPLFTLIYPENNIVGVEPGVAQAVSESYSFIIAPPPPGQYEIASTARYAGEPATRPTATVTIIVEAPQLIEPPPTT
jgi:hypothetical protein